MIRRLAALFLLLSSLGVFIPAPVLAQEAEDEQIILETDKEATNPLFFSVSPENPAPRQSVTVTVKSYSVDLSRADIRWREAGKTVLSGIGRTSYAFTAKDAGSATALSVSVTPAGSESSYESSISVRPAAIDILWQATDSVVPPLYRGKALPTSESAVRFVAMSDLRSSAGRISPSSLVYTWEQDGVRSGAASGYGKSSFLVSGNYLSRALSASVTAESRDGSVSGEGTVMAAFANPKILWYPVDPVVGPRFERVIPGAADVAGTDISVLAEPYFFSPGNTLSPNLSYVWTQNGSALPTPAIPNTLFLRRDEGQTGEAILRLSVSNAMKLFQEAAGTLTLRLK